MALGSFSMDLSRFCKKYDTDIKLVIRKISFEAFKRIVLRTPVDTGRARANWGVKVGSPTTFAIESFDKSGTATLKTASDGTMAWDCTGSLFFTNNLPYIGTLEYGGFPISSGAGSKTSGGFSTQAPNGMVRVTLEEMRTWVKGAAA